MGDDGSFAERGRDFYGRPFPTGHLLQEHRDIGDVGDFKLSPRQHTAGGGYVRNIRLTFRDSGYKPFLGNSGFLAM